MEKFVLALLRETPTFICCFNFQPPPPVCSQDGRREAVGGIDKAGGESRVFFVSEALADVGY